MRKSYQISRLAGLSLIMLALLGLTACSSATNTAVPVATAAPSSGAKTYIANLDNAPSTARAVVVVENGKFDAYVCSLDQAFNQTSARWYKGQLDATGSFQGVSADGVEFKGSVKDNQFTGSVLNTQKKSYTFKGEVLASGNTKAGLYRGLGNYNGKEVIVGATITGQGVFAATAQYKGVMEFINPVVDQPVFLADGVLGVKIGDTKQQVEVKLVTTLSGTPLF
jgi:hypothetical protein